MGTPSKIYNGLPPLIELTPRITILVLASVWSLPLFTFNLKLCFETIVQFYLFFLVRDFG